MNLLGRIKEASRYLSPSYRYLKQTHWGRIYDSYDAVARGFNAWGKREEMSFEEAMRVTEYSAPSILYHLMEKYLPSLPAYGLDVGCGNGASGLPFLEAGYTVDGIDLSFVLLRQAKQKGYRRTRQLNLAVQKLDSIEQYPIAFSTGIMGEYVPEKIVLRNISPALADNAVIGFSSVVKEREDRRSLQKLLSGMNFEIAEFQSKIEYHNSNDKVASFAPYNFVVAVRK